MQDDYTGPTTAPAADLMAMEQGSEAWKLARRTMVTSTDVASIVGCRDAYKRKNQLFQEKVGLRSSEPTSQFAADMLDYGIEQEPSAIRALEHFLGNKCRVEKAIGLVVHPKHAWLGGSPDGVIKDRRALVEIKCPTNVPAAGLDDYYPVPERYRHQVQLLMECMDLDMCYLARYFPHGGPLRRRDSTFTESIYVDMIARDRTWIVKHLGALKEFHDDLAEYRTTGVLKPAYQIRTQVRQTSNKRRKITQPTDNNNDHVIHDARGLQPDQRRRRQLSSANPTRRHLASEFPVVVGRRRAAAADRAACASEPPSAAPADGPPCARQAGPCRTPAGALACG